MSKKYGWSILIGFLTFVLIYLYYKRFYIEGFTGETTESVTPVEGETVDATSATKLIDSLKSLLTGVIQQNENNTFTYIEDKNKIPNINHLIFYLSCYSDFTSYDEKQNGYVASTNKWYNHLTKIDPFNIISSSILPVSIRPPSGLPMLNKRIIGPRSDQLNTNNYTLNAFTVSFFVKNEDFVFEDNNPIELFKIYVESPNYIKMFIEPNELDSTKVNLVTIFGTLTDRYVIPIAKLALKASGNPVLMTFTYDSTEKPNPKLYVYIGESQFSSSAITTPPAFVLGNSNIEINNNQTWNTALYAFMYFKNSITLDIQKQLIDYFNLQASGISSMVEQLKQLSEKQVEEINQLISSQSLTIDQVRKDLEQCKVANSKYETDKQNKELEKWMVQMDGYKTVSQDDLQKCTLLKVNNPYVSGSTSNLPVPESEKTTEQFKISIPDYLKGIESIKPELSGIVKKSDDLKGTISNYFKS